MPTPPERPLDPDGKPITYTYRLYEYRNGLDETMFKAKQRGILFGWNWIRWEDLHGGVSFDNLIIEWPTRGRAIDALTAYSDRQIAAIAATTKAARRAKTKLILIQDLNL